MKVSGTVIVVTGAGSGMGRELAETAQLVTALGGKISTHALDITDAKSVAALPTAVTAALGHADGLVNNAGIIQPFVKINDLDIADAERVMDVNFYGPLRLIKSFLPGLLTRPEAHILNVSSMGAHAPVRRRPTPLGLPPGRMRRRWTYSRGSTLSWAAGIIYKQM